MLLEEVVGETALYNLTLKRNEGSYKAILGISHVPPETLWEEKESFLNEGELLVLETLKLPLVINNFLKSKYISKHVVGQFISEQNLKNIQIKYGVFNQPIIVHANASGLHLSISHSGNVGTCLVFSEEHPMAVDIEQVSVNAKENIRSQLTDNEILMTSTLSEVCNSSYTMFWTIKEALSKVLKTGLTVPMHIFEVESVFPQNKYFISYFRHFLQYKACSYSLNNYMFSIVLPAKSDIFIERILG